MTSIRILTELADSGQRLDVYLSGYLERYSRSYLQKILKSGQVLVDGTPEKSSYRLKGDEEIRMDLPEVQTLEVEPENIPLEIVYEDEDVLVINKAKGMVVHPAPGHPGGTVVNAVMYHCGDKLSGINGVLRPGIVHRIDRDTTGLLIICKNDKAHASIAAQLAEHSITRRYHAIVQGVLREDEGVIDKSIGRDKKNRLRMAVVMPDQGRHAVTHYKVLQRLKGYTYIECRLETGRTHQIRVHMSSIGHPLLGDELYGAAKSRFVTEGQCLHAKVLGFVHPSTGEYMEFDSELPAYMEDIIKKLS